MSSEPWRVLVIGGGIAGTAAAWAASRRKGPQSAGDGSPKSSGDPGVPSSRRAGPRHRPVAVNVVSAGAGASALASGAVDDIPWEEVARAARIQGAEPHAKAIDAEVLAFAEDLGVWRLVAEGAPPALLATAAGRVRPARGHDRALLDLRTLTEGTVAVPRFDRAGWDADALAASWNAEPRARAQGLRFVPIDATLMRYDGEHRLSDLDLASRHDDERRLSWLAERLRDALARTAIHPVAVLLGPWLGTSAPRASALEKMLGIRAGEALAGAGGPAGMRFVFARDRLFERSGIAQTMGRVEDVRLDDDDEGRPSIGIEGEDGVRFVDRMVVACGGLLGGGIVYDPPDRHAGTDMPDKRHPPFRMSFDVTARDEDEMPCFGVGGRRIGILGSMFGPVLDASAWPKVAKPGVLEAVGWMCDDAGRAGPHVLAAGDVVADRPRTALIAACSGIRAGAVATSDSPFSLEPP